MKYASAAAFERALSDTLKNRLAGNPRLSFQHLRRQVAFDRLLARLSAIDNESWLLKGGVALEFRFVHARMTTDVDLSAHGEPATFIDSLRRAAQLDLGDYFTFAFTRDPYRPVPDLETTYRFSLESRLNDRRFEPLTVDVGFADPWLGRAETLAGSDILGFAGIAPVNVRGVAPEQMIAEKLHAYTRVYIGRESTRVKDLVDLVLLSSYREIDGILMRSIIVQIFETRNTHDLPASFPPPPQSWRVSYRALAEPLGIDPDYEGAFKSVAGFIDPILGNEARRKTWHPDIREWS